MHTHTQPHPFLALTLEWNYAGRSSAARAAIVRWAATTPALAPFATPADAVDACGQRRDPRSPQSVLAALVHHGPDDPLAARAALQALLPGLVALARRGNVHGRLVGAGRPFATYHDLDAELASITYERIRTGVGADSPWPATKILDSTWMRVRTLGRIHRRLAAVETPQGTDIPDRRAAAERSGAEELAQVIVGAVQAGTVRRTDGALVYANRVLGHSMFELARVTGRNESVLRRERGRGEHALLAAS
jgi:hypothetical protein